MPRHLLVAALLASSSSAFAQAPPPEARAVVELGGATSWDVSGPPSAGADLAVEVTPVENWLEIEVGTAPLFGRHSVEWDTDALFKKPWSLSRTAELMVGFGPEWVHTREFGRTRNAVAGELALDWMFWPGARHRLGWFIEPAYEYLFGAVHERSIGVSWGLLMSVP